MRRRLVLEAAELTVEVGEEGSGEELALGPNLLGVEVGAREEVRERWGLDWGGNGERGVEVLQGRPGGGGEVGGRGEVDGRVGVPQPLQRHLTLLRGERLVQVHRHGRGGWRRIG